MLTKYEIIYIISYVNVLVNRLRTTQILIRKGGINLKVTIRILRKSECFHRNSVKSNKQQKSEGVGEETRKRILKLVKELGYQPNALARGLVTKKTKTVGLIIPDITNPFFADIARGGRPGQLVRV